MIQLLQRWFDPSTIEILGWTLVHFLWQGAAVALLLAGLLAILRRRSPAARYMASCLALVAMALLPAMTFAYLTHRQALAATNAPVISSAAVEHGTASPAELRFDIALRPQDANDPADARVISQQSARDEAFQPAAISDWLADRMRPALPWLVGGWCLGVLALSTRLAGGWMQLVAIKRDATAVPNDWAARLPLMMQRLRIARPVRLLAAARVEVPCALGWLKPVILVPVGMLSGLSAQQVEAILAHELAHIRRHDYLVNLIQSVLEALLFYHPAVWWVSRRIRIEREHCCDDIAAEVCGSPLQYARALAILEEMRCAPASLALAASGGQLLPRIRRLLGLPDSNPGAHPWASLGIAVMAIVLTLLLLSHTRIRGAAANPEGLQGEVDVPALVREVRRRELWVDDVESLRIHAEGTFGARDEAGKPADADAAEPQYKVDTAFDRKRLHIHMLGRSPWPREYRQLWNGDKFIDYSVRRDGKREYALSKDFTSFPLSNSSTRARVFDYLHWPRQAPHAYWWEPEEQRDGEAFHGRPEDYRLAGREKFRGVECYALETDIFHRTLYVGVADGNLHGVNKRILARSAEPAATRIYLEVAREHGRLFEDLLQYFEWERSLPPEQRLAVRREYFKRIRPLTVPWRTSWYADWREVQPGRWVPMRHGYYWRDEDDSAGRYSQGTCEFRITHIAIDQPLPDDLFKIEFEEGVQMYDWSHDPPLFYPYKKNRTPEEWQVIKEEARKRKAAEDVERILHEGRKLQAQQERGQQPPRGGNNGE